MSPKQRFQMFIEPEQLDALRAIEAATGAPVARQIRMAIDRWLAQQGRQKADRRRAPTRKRS